MTMLSYMQQGRAISLDLNRGMFVFQYYSDLFMHIYYV